MPRNRSLLAGIIILSYGLLCVNLAVAAESKEKADQPKTQASQPKAKKSEEKTPLQKFMRAKLGGADDVLEGLVTEDFRLIKKGATELKRIGTAAKWRISNDVMYRQHSNVFQRAVGTLDDMVSDKNLDGAALAYIDLTMNCIDCHRWAKGILITKSGFGPRNNWTRGLRPIEPAKLPTVSVSADKRLLGQLDSTPVLQTAAVAQHGANTLYVSLEKEKTQQPEKESNKALRLFMRAKLVNAERALEGLVTEDFELVKSGAQKMLLMSQAESWSVLKTPQFKQHTEEFQRTAKQLLRNVKDQNLDGAALSYLQLTMNCIGCHRHVRSVKVTWSRPKADKVVGLRRDRR